MQKLRNLYKTSPFAQSLRQTQILVLKILKVFLRLHAVKRQRQILALTLPQSCGIALAGSLTAVQFRFPAELPLNLNKIEHFSKVSF